ncbi:hypothetical protein F7725_008540 [Dissostichus mawsoni]|uniref:Solute carrier family 3 member 2 N-terminal domain-containing protein n=1 Tax=Dissostichus mawsoni TaxID=36200 RepID=A0A7J5Y9Z8_DISMA|nr:hypothetical protein F7725_008540 [Dissostichus mawsoni]
MTTEETNVDLKEVETKDAQLKEKEEAEDCAPVAADADATEADVSEADLDQEEQEKLPMTGGEGEGDRAVEAPSAGGAEPGPAGEKNGSVKLKIPEEEPEEVKFTGLSKEELMRVAGTPGWVRTRWALLVVFWLGWLGMLGGAVLIVLQAPRCRDLPAINWWNEGPLYQRHRDLKGISVVLDLTPNYQGTSGPWFSNTSVTSVAERLKSALVFWMKEGVDGVQLSGVERVAAVVPTLVLIGITERSSAEEVSSLLSSSGVDLLLSGVLRPPAADPSQSLQLLYSSHSQSQLAWSLGGPAGGHLASVGGAALLRLHQLLLLTLPGTPVFNYGDEIGLMDEDTKFPRMLWDSEEELNGTLQLRVKERSLMFGDFLLLSNSSSSSSSSSSLAYLRVWDQSERYVAAFNFAAAESAVLQLVDAALPPQAVVVLSTNSSALPGDSSVDLKELRLGPLQAALLRFPYTG